MWLYWSKFVSLSYRSFMFRIQPISSGCRLGGALKMNGACQIFCSPQKESLDWKACKLILISMLDNEYRISRPWLTRLHRLLPKNSCKRKAQFEQFFKFDWNESSKVANKRMWVWKKRILCNKGRSGNSYAKCSFFYHESYTSEHDLKARAQPWIRDEYW